MSFSPANYARDLQQCTWLWSVGTKTAEKGAGLHQSGAVKGFEASAVANGQIRITANVHHPGRKSNQGVLIFLSRQREGQVMITPNCSCQEEAMCKHAVSVLYEFISHYKSDTALARRRTASLKRRRGRGLGTTRYLACQIVPVRDDHLALEVLLSAQAIIDEHRFCQCSGRDLFGPELAEELGQAWMRRLLERLREDCPGASDDVARLHPSPDAWTEWIEELLKWQILYWGGGPNPVLIHRGNARAADPSWHFNDEREAFVAAWDVDDPAHIIVPSSPLHYIDTRRRLIGEVKTSIPNNLACHWIPNSKPTAEQITRWNDGAEPGAGFPHPPTLEVIDARQTNPIPCLHLSHHELPRSAMRGFWSPVFREQPVAALVFCYGEHEVPERGKGYALQDERFRILRNEAAEKAASETLDQLGLLPFCFSIPPDAVTPELTNLRWIGTWDERALQMSWMTLMTEHVPALEDAGWQIRFEENFAMRFVQPDRWIQKLREQRSRSWFDFELGIECDGQRTDLIPVLIAYLQHHADIERRIQSLDPRDRIPIQLEDGRYLAFPVGRLEPIVRILKDILQGRGARPRERETHQVHQLLAAEFLKDSSRFTRAGEASASLAALSRQLDDFDGIPEREPPVGLKATLRNYQRDGFRWLQFLGQFRLGGILADDMGLGKTLQTIVHLLAEKEKGALTKPALVVVPTSLLGNWQDELEKFAPGLRVHLYYGAGRQGQRQSFDAADVVITSYSLLYRDQEWLETRSFSHLILDEAQNIKNPASRSARAACALDADHRLCLSGTPLQNHLEELWSLFHFLMPGFLGGLSSFRQRFRRPIEREHDEFTRDLLASRVGPLMLRRKKAEVAQELPPKTEMLRSVELEGPQRDLYETIRASMQKRVQEVIAEQGIERAHLHILDALLKLRQVCCHPHLLDLEAAQSVEGSAKLELLFDLLPELLCEGRRVLLFSQFTSMLELIEKRLASHDISYVKLTGSTRNRPEVIRRFQDGKVPLFLISLKAGGLGLNLTQADTVIHYDPWWNPAVEDQATDRAHRIGQDQPVFVYKLITKGSIEERMLAMQEDKRELVEGLLSAGAKRGLKLGQAALEQLLRPLS